MDTGTTTLEPFQVEHRGGYLADSQFDYPGSDPGWMYLALNAANEFTRLEPPASSRDTATPLAYLGCDDPHARVSRDSVHAGYQRRPCLQWHAPAAGTYRLEGEVALLLSQASGQFNVRVIVDDVELLTRTLCYPQVLSFAIDAAVGRSGFMRVLFASQQHIDSNEALFYLRVRAADAPCQPGGFRIDSRCEASAAWQRLQDVIGADPGQMPDQGPDLARLAQGLYGGPASADPVLARMAQDQAQTLFAPRLERYRQPRYFSIHPASTTAAGT